MLRRRLLPTIAGVLVLLAAVPVLRAQEETEWKPKAGLPLTEPKQVHSRNGVLKVTLDARRRAIDLSGSRIEAQPFNGRLIGPTLHVRPGDTLDVTLRNATSERTNIHYHGMHVSPRGISDNVFRTFRPGRATRSVVHVPSDHSPGTYWYHVHLHGLTEEQVMGGMSGLLIVEGLKDLLPESLRGVRERQLAIRDVQHRGDSILMDAADIDVQKPTTRLVNGLLLPRFGLRSGETQLWRIANVGADIYYDVQLTGHRLHVIAEDGSPVWRVWSRRHLVLPPGKRYDVLVRGGRPGRYVFRTLHYDEGFQLLPRSKLASVRVRGPAGARRPLPRRLDTPAQSLADLPVRRRRTFTFSFDFSKKEFALINGQAFNPNVTNVAPLLGSVEEWTLRNVSTEDHPFHIHVNDFQVMRVNGRPYRARGLQDVVVLPKRGGTVVIRNVFDRFTGHYVFHCHILNHEDHGQMKTVQVIRRGQKPSPPPGAAHDMERHISGSARR
jgi:FtsP/CotA-like multicopper oxidase with cupredoxin domain